MYKQILNTLFLRYFERLTVNFAPSPQSLFCFILDLQYITSFRARQESEKKKNDRLIEVKSCLSIKIFYREVGK